MSDETWRDRLGAALTEKGLSMRKVSLDSDLGAGYVFSILKEGKEPTIENLVRVCDVVGVPLGRIIFGDGASAERDELLALFSRANPMTRRGILEVLRGHKET